MSNIFDVEKYRNIKSFGPKIDGVESIDVSGLFENFKNKYYRTVKNMLSDIPIDGKEQSFLSADRYSILNSTIALMEFLFVLTAKEFSFTNVEAITVIASFIQTFSAGFILSANSEKRIKSSCDILEDMMKRISEVIELQKKEALERINEP